MFATKLFPLPLFAAAAVLGAGCGLIGDDDSAMDDDSSMGDDDDSSMGDDDDDSSMGDDDDSAMTPEYPLELDVLAIDCTGNSGTSSMWNFDLSTIGWVDFGGAWLFMWDGYTFEDEHYIDAWAPFQMTNTEFSDEVAQWDHHVLDVEAFSTIGAAEDAHGTDGVAGTILQCNDALGTPNVEVHNYMVCATDYLDATMQHCWVCAPDLGEASIGDTGTVGEFDGDTGSWTYTEEVDCELTSTLETR